MAKAKAKLFYTTSKYLDTLPVKNGNIIFVSDINTVCLDMHNRRTTYTTIYTFGTDWDRQHWNDPQSGFYFVKNTNILWRYDEDRGWRQITASGLNPVIISQSKEEFPEEGDESKLYVSDDGVWTWKDGNQDYYLVANKSEWETN